MGKISGTALAVVVASGSMAAAGAPAQAAAPKCTTATWRLTKAAGQVKSRDSLLKFGGGTGTTLRLAAGGQATYDFARSRRVTESATVRRVPLALWWQYGKVLRVKATVTGNRSGTIALRRQTAAGPATLEGRFTRPRPVAIKKRPLAPLLKRGETDEALLPLKVTYTCSRTTLHLRQRGTVNGYTKTADWWYTRVARPR